MGSPPTIGGGSTQFQPSLATGTPRTTRTGGETLSNLSAILDPASNIDRIKSKLDKHTGIDDLIAVQAQFDLETQRLKAQRDEILNRINTADLEASRAVRESRINQARRTGRSATILSR
jgi:hypothetical protein